MPFSSKKRWRFQTVNMPLLTHFLGPGITPGNGSASTRLLRQIDITRDLIKRLPAGMTSFTQKMHKGVNEVIAFQMEGFESSVQFTYLLEAAPAAALWRQMRDKTRNVIRKADKTYAVDDNIDTEEFIRFYKANLSERKRPQLWDFRLIHRLIDANRERGYGQILAARDPDGTVKAGIFCVWDHDLCYYLLSTRTLDSGNGAVPLLLWTAIQRSAAGGLVFDFDGLGQEGAVLFFSGFGGKVDPRYIVSRSAHSHTILREMRRMLFYKDNPFT